MISVNFSGLNESLLYVGVGNMTSVLEVGMLTRVMLYEVWLLVITAVVLGVFFYTRELLLALMSIIILSVNMYVFQYMALSQTELLIIRCIFLLLIAGVAAFMLTGRRKSHEYT